MKPSKSQCAICGGLALIVFVIISSSASAAVTPGLNPGGFNTPTIEKFQGTYISTTSYNFGNGMSFLDLGSQSDHINYTGGYGMADEPSINSGKDGPGDGYFGTGPTPTTFQFGFSGGVTQFGFFGAESSVSGGTQGRNAEMNLEFFDLSNVSIGTCTFSTAGIFAWNQFHGFSSEVPIGRVVFLNAGHMVVDDVYFGQAVFVPEPTTAALGLLGAGLLFFRRRS